jgi:universal protein Kae1
MCNGYCLGIESTADDFSIGIVSFKGEVLANIVRSYIPEKGGIHPREAARHHAKVASMTLKDALKKAKLEVQEITTVSFSQVPGMGPCLRTGASAARALASYLNVPLIGVNHLVAHIEIGKLTTGLKDPVVLFVSGGSTIVSTFEGSRYRILGETLDIALGNCIDVFARKAGLISENHLPGAAKVMKLANMGNNLVPLPYVVKGMDLSFSGLLTSAISLLHKEKYKLEDLCFSLQEHAFSMVTEVTERALAHTEKQEVLLTGGNAANKRLQEMLQIMVEDHIATFGVVPIDYATDNGAMIAWTGILCYKYNLTVPIPKSFVKLDWRLDDVKIPWVDI